MDKGNFERAKWIPICLIAILLMVVYKTIDNISQITSAVSRFFSVISPLLYGTLFTYFLYVPQQKLEKLYSTPKARFLSRKPRLFSILTIFLLLILIIAFLISFVIPLLITSVIDLANSVPGYVSFVLDYFDSLPEDSYWYSLQISDVLRDSSSGILYQYLNLGTIEQVARSVMSFAGELFSLLLGLIISLYLLLEKEKILDFFRRLGVVLFKKEKVRDRLTKYLGQVNNVLFTFIASKGLDSIINLVVVTSILLIFGVPHAVLLGLIAGLFNFIPYLGSLIAVILITVITLITGGLAKGIQVLIPLLIFQQLDGNFIEPRIMKSSLKISPILVILAVVVGGAYFGIVGMFLAVPIVAIIKQILLEYVGHSEDLAGDEGRG